jgi:hypothetical protein
MSKIWFFGKKQDILMGLFIRNQDQMETLQRKNHLHLMLNRYENTVNFKGTWMLLIGMAFMLSLAGGCQEEGLPDEEGAEISLRRVPGSPGYASLPLMDTRWKLIGFVEGNRIRLAKPKGGDSYTLIFKDTGVITGKTSTNAAYGEYSLPGDWKISVSVFHNMTEMAELFDGPLYIESINKVLSYRISSKGLELHYDANKYLLFQPTKLNLPE